MGSHLAVVAGLPPVPATVSPAVTHEGGVPAQHDVEDHAETPQVTALVVDGGLFIERLYHFGSHVLRRAALRETHTHDSHVSK